MTNLTKTDIESTFCKIPGFINFLYSRPMLTVLRNNGYIAGGFARYLLSILTRKGTAVEETAHFDLIRDYIWQGGDVDVFFRTERDAIAACEEFEDMSEQKFARAIFAKNHYVTFPELREKRVKVQFVTAHYGEPESVLKSFDLVNSMVCFDRTHMWVADAWKDLELACTLDIARQNEGMGMLGRRVEKYARKYGYWRMTPTSEKVYSRWFRDGVDSMLAVKQLTQQPAGFNLERIQDEKGFYTNPDLVPHSAFSLSLRDEYIPAFAGFSERHITNDDQHNRYYLYENSRLIDCAVAELISRSASTAVIDAAHDRARYVRHAKLMKRIHNTISDDSSITHSDIVNMQWMVNDLYKKP